MKYKCLVLDHDDTVVSSTAEIHFPCFVEYLLETGREENAREYDLATYLIRNFDPGITSILKDELKLTDKEMEEEIDYWGRYVDKITPTAYEGIGDIISEFRRRGGFIAVSSHSFERYIRRDYEANSLPMPDVIYGWDIPDEMRKPSSATIFDVMKKYGFTQDEILVVDDLKPGFDMARGAGVDFAAAGWAYDVPEIEAFMRRHCDYYLSSVAELHSLLFD